MYSKQKHTIQYRTSFLTKKKEMYHDEKEKTEHYDV